ncbi:MAG: MarR family transcriptional regulator [Clostridiales bacterium]|nr:MarR family transcriptional regulator [Clostridiales bacterium]
MNKDTFAYELMDEFRKFKHLTRPNHKENLLEHAEFLVMMVIMRNNDEFGTDISPSQISDEIGFSRSSLTPLLNSLEEKGYITRRLSREDKRMFKLEVTEKYKQIHLEAIEKHCEKFYLLIEYLGEKDAKDLVRIIKKANKFFSENEGNMINEKTK